MRDTYVADDHEGPELNIKIPAFRRRLYGGTPIIERHVLRFQQAVQPVFRDPFDHLPPFCLNLGEEYGAFPLELCHIDHAMNELKAVKQGTAQHVRLKLGVNFDLTVTRVHTPGSIALDDALFLMLPENAKTFEPLVLNATSMGALCEAFESAWFHDDDVDVLGENWLTSIESSGTKPGTRDYAPVPTPARHWEHAAPDDVKAAVDSTLLWTNPVEPYLGDMK
ncbi:hypothetical protein BD830_10744 [Maritimibacter alkaliphilus HTCC2654]|uniref:Uncharacterized protein n=2 Tax=Maritimibacter TaxID=404235 RepID=A3VLG7_9RHOB|nr:hypothetical protein [Maritimibacter alkaliphilus]EAQ10855.1 hypothetical protein RB2654_21843 [Rhodobacterales bacterium HTCC2654] [Maritimibacter alkaliphilus HTCC2654]TYP80493.1 hypothetical protein BD830_10744 [Maritimibacter alkaliphilus HTCC2654]